MRCSIVHRGGWSPAGVIHRSNRRHRSGCRGSSPDTPAAFRVMRPTSQIGRSRAPDGYPTRKPRLQSPLLMPELSLAGKTVNPASVLLDGDEFEEIVVVDQRKRSNPARRLASNRPISRWLHRSVARGHERKSGCYSVQLYANRLQVSPERGDGFRAILLPLTNEKAMMYS